MKNVSSYNKSLDLLTCDNTTINLKNIDHRCFQYAFMLTQHYKKSKFHIELVTNTVINNNDYTFLEKKILEIALIVF